MKGRILSCLLIILLVVSGTVFAAGAKEKTVETGPVNIVAWLYTSLQIEEIDKAVESFHAKYPDIRVEVVPTQYGSASFRDKYIVANQAGGGPDVIMGDIVWGPELAAMQAIYPIDSLMKPGSLEEFYPGPVDTLRYQGKVYGLPFYTNALAMYINKTAFRNAGLPIPNKDWANTWTWDEFHRAVRTLTTGNMHGYGVMAGWGASFEFFSFLWSNNGRVLNEDFTKPAINSPEGRQAVERFIGLITDGYTPEASKTWKSWDELHASFANGLIATYMCGDWGLNPVANMEPNFEWDVVPIPVMQVPSSLVGGANLMINSQTKHPDAAYKFIEHLTSPEVTFDFMDAHNRLAARVGTSSSQRIVRENPKMEVFLDALRYARARPPIPKWTAIDWNAVQPALASIFLEGKSVNAAVQEIEQNIISILADN